MKQNWWRLKHYGKYYNNDNKILYECVHYEKIMFIVICLFSCNLVLLDFFSCNLILSDIF
jgi:hypothetical protein